MEIDNMEEMMLRISNLSKRYGKKVVLRGIDADFPKGRIVAIVGDNGTGKSTLIKIILGLAKKSGGDIDCRSHGTGGILETPCFLTKFSGRENIRMLCGKGRLDEGKLIELADLFNLGDDLDLQVKKYSLGMRQKLAIIYVLLTDADILLFDEPTNALDQSALVKFKDLLLEEKKNGKLVIISSHNQEYLNKFVDDVYELRDGILRLVDIHKSSKDMIHMFEFHDMGRALMKARENGCIHDSINNRFMVIKDWFLSLDDLFSMFMDCGIRLYMQLDGLRDIYQQMKGAFDEERTVQAP